MRSSSASARRSWPIGTSSRARHSWITPGFALWANTRKGTWPSGPASSASWRRVLEDAQRLAAQVAQRPLREVERAVGLRAALVAAAAGVQHHEPGAGADADQH